MTTLKKCIIGVECIVAHIPSNVIDIISRCWLTMIKLYRRLQQNLLFSGLISAVDSTPHLLG